MAAPSCHQGWGRLSAARTWGGMAASQSSSNIILPGSSPLLLWNGSLGWVGRDGGGGRVYSAPQVSQCNPFLAAGCRDRHLHCSMHK